MKSLKELLILGPGPSSSHTIGPYRICLDFLSSLKNKNKILNIEVILYGSLALTGKGHKTDKVILSTLKDYKVNIIFNYDFKNLTHPNTLQITAFYSNKKVSQRYVSIGGGSFKKENEKYDKKDVYDFKSLKEVEKYLNDNNLTILDLIYKYEDKDIYKYAFDLLKHSFKVIKEELSADSTILPPLNINTVAKEILERSKIVKNKSERRILELTSYAYATSEANAKGKKVVTTPTCGASGVVPSCLYYEKVVNKRNMKDLTEAFLVGAFICNFIKENAAISGAMLGCQAEIGSACSFAASSLAFLNKLGTFQIEYAAEVAMEHFLGLTCDPVDGYVMIPCIERNGIAAIHAYSAYLFAKDISPYRKNKISFDNVIQAMKETGLKMDNDFKETAKGGLAKIYSSTC